VIVGWVAIAALSIAPRSRGPDVDEGWKVLFGELARLRAGELGDPEVELVRARLGEAAREYDGDPRGELVLAELETIAGRDAGALASRLAALEPDPFSSDEHWFLADSLPPGPTRASSVVRGLEVERQLTRWELLLGWNVAVDEARALRLAEGALPIQRRLHERYLADWSAMDLALTLRLLGDRPAVEALFEETITRESAAGRPVQELWAQRGIAAVGFGDERRGRDYLGRALALGSDDASLVLGRMDLAAGKKLSSRHGFRASILTEPPADWAWRGWGTTLLPDAHQPPAAARSASISPHPSPH